MATMTTREVGARLGISDSGVRKLVERQRLYPVRRRAKPMRFRDSDVWRLERDRRSDADLGAIRAAHAEAGT